MQTTYFKQAWDDVTGEPGWFKTILLLSLIALIPVVGQMIVYGFLFQWAKEAAWGINKPLPKKIGDWGALLKPGAIVWVIFFVGELVLSLIISAVSAIPIVGTIFSLVGIVVTVLAYMLFAVMAMRCVIYDSFDPALQFNQAWDMVTRELNGLIRVALIMVVFSAIITVIATILSVAIVGSTMVCSPRMLNAGTTEELLQAFLPMLPVITVGTIVLVLVGTVIGTLGYAVTIRALGFWTAQFEPAKWGPSTMPVPADVGPRR